MLYYCNMLLWLFMPRCMSITQSSCILARIHHIWPLIKNIWKYSRREKKKFNCSLSLPLEKKKHTAASVCHWNKFHERVFCCPWRLMVNTVCAKVCAVPWMRRVGGNCLRETEVLSAGDGGCSGDVLRTNTALPPMRISYTARLLPSADYRKCFVVKSRFPHVFIGLKSWLGFGHIWLSVVFCCRLSPDWVSIGF